MKLFTVGPVEMYPSTLKIEGKQQPYFRTEEFSKVMKNIEKNFLASVFAPKNALFVALTCSGTGAMEAAVVNTVNKDDKVLVINGGSFGTRFKELCKYHGFEYDEYLIPYGEAFDKEEFEKFSQKGFTVLLVNACETGTAQKYDLKYLGDFCKKNDMIFIVDAVSAYLADPIFMEECNIDILFTASQKALALAPGISLVAISERAYSERIVNNHLSYYFDFNYYIDNQKRGQTPFTPAVGTLLALDERLQTIIDNSIEVEWKKHRNRAEHFRRRLKELPLNIPSYPMSNCCTCILFDDNASEIYTKFKEKYDIYLTPSGGELKNKQLRVGHLGNLELCDYDLLIELLKKELY